MYIQYHNNPKLISSISRIYYPIINLFMIMTMIKALRIRMKFGSKICKTCSSRGCAAILGEFTIYSTGCKQKLLLENNQLKRHWQNIVITKETHII